MKKLTATLLTLALCFSLCFAFSACENTGNSSSQVNENSTVESASTETSTSNSAASGTSTKIFLAGDSTVKTYQNNQYIGGWGQYLSMFLNTENITVVNKSEGGRSSRSFINEGRLFTNSELTTSYTSIESEIAEGDYLFIQFGHNDDETNGITNNAERHAPLGEADGEGIFPSTPGVKSPTTYLPEAYKNAVDAAAEQAMIDRLAKYCGSEYYASDTGGTYKWYLKQYIKFARDKGAIPVLITPCTRVKFDSTGNEIIGGSGRFGANFEYITAVRQTAEEENCLLIDLFADSKALMETVKSANANYLMALKPNSLTGEWPTGYDNAYMNTEAGYTGIEATHYNKYGAFVLAAFVADSLKEFTVQNTVMANNESIGFGASILTTPKSFIAPSSKLDASLPAAIQALLTHAKIFAA